MLVTDYFFLIYFFPVFLLSYFLVQKNALLSNLLIILASILYYASFEVSHLWVLILPFFVDYVIALLIHHIASEKIKKILLAVAIIYSLGLLGYYKYMFLGVTTLRSLLNKPFLFPTAVALIMPVGISFITFQRLSYVIDTYRQKIKPTYNLIEYLVYAAFFAQLLAGPIVRFHQVKNQLAKRVLSFDLMFEGIKYLAFGLVSKILIADQLFGLENRLTSQLTELNIMTASLLIFYFSFRIYFDFMGYSLMAIGLAKFVGFHFPDNFDSPYQAEGFRDFWRRWNITLSKWFQDYLYIPLGGSRKGFWRTQINLMITMLLVGWWHGAEWSFMIWGGIHGTLLVIERLASQHLKFTITSGWKKFLTFAVVAVAWIPFKFSKLPELISFISSFNNINVSFANVFTQNLFFTTVPSLLLACTWVLYFKEKNIVNIKPSLIKVVGFSLICFFTVSYSLRLTQVPFIYFQF